MQLSTEFGGTGGSCGWSDLLPCGGGARATFLLRQQAPRTRQTELSGKLAGRHDDDAGPCVTPTSLDRRRAGHGMLNAGLIASRPRIAVRHVLVKLLSKLPGTRFKSTLVRRLLGVRMGRDVGLAYGVFLDPYDPTLISIGDNVLVGYETAIFVHMFTLTRQRIRPVTIGSNVMIGARCLVAPGVTIGDGASIAPGTVVSRDVPTGALAMGNPMQIHRRGGGSAAAKQG